MAQFGQYRCYLLDWQGDPVTQLFPGDDFMSITWQHTQNAPGTYRVELVGETGTKDQFRKFYQVQLQRNWGNAPGDWYEEFVGFHLGTDEWWDSASGVDTHYWASLGQSPEWLISQPLLLPLENTGNPDWTYYDQWANHGFSDDVVKSMVAESMVSPSATARAFTNMAVAGNEGAGAWNCYEGQWVRLLQAVTDTIGSDGTRGDCDFRVERVTGGYEFRTYAPYYGTDRRRGNAYGNKPVIFSQQNGNVTNLRRITIWGEAVTVAYGGGEGYGMEKSIYTETNAAALAETPWSRREEFYDVSDVAQPSAIPGYLQQKLIDEGEQEFVTATILQTNACLYGRDWQFGDLVTVDFPDGLSYSMRVIEVAGRISGDNEEEIEGTVEQWTRG